MTPSLLIVVGAAPEAPLQARRNGSSGVVDRRRVTGWIAREPGRSCPCPWARKLERECQHEIQTPVRRRRLRGDGSALVSGHEPRQATARGAGWRKQ